jgi:3D (Asp-Asp-Asp) domain-containing protein
MAADLRTRLAPRSFVGVAAVLMACSSGAPQPGASFPRAKPASTPAPSAPAPASTAPSQIGPAIPAYAGQSLGTFRNTYYDFPQARDYSGNDTTPLFDARCKSLARVPTAFHDAVCVQGSGQLANGRTVSFAKRDCPCARVCPRTGQRICFEALDPAAFPYGRGALGQAVVPLSSVAVDSELIALGTTLFIPEFAGLPRDASEGTPHDGCFLAHDRGVKVRGSHVDVFTGGEAATRRWNQLLPSNRGVTVILDSPNCPAVNALRPTRTTSGP